MNEIASKFTDFGDFNIVKDSGNSCYLEFYFIEPKKVPTQKLEEVIQQINANKEQIGVRIATPYSGAVKFESHNRIEWEGRGSNNFINSLISHIFIINY